MLPRHNDGPNQGHHPTGWEREGHIPQDRRRAAWIREGHAAKLNGSVTFVAPGADWSLCMTPPTTRQNSSQSIWP